MLVKRLEITNVRNIASAQLLGLAPVTIFYGVNGSGKTSVLEAIHLLSSGRSFRNNKHKSLIRHDTDQLVVFAELYPQEYFTAHNIGIVRKLNGDCLIKLDGDSARKASSLAEHLPVLVINSETFLLLEGAPQVRRQFLDWGLFHVEQNFHSVWKELQRCLKHRNTLLRHGRIDEELIKVWNDYFIKLSQQMDEYRQSYINQFMPIFSDCLKQLTSLEGKISLQYYRGWNHEHDLSELIENNSDKELEQGYSLYGPQRADLRIKYDGRPAAEVLSRGQQKLVVCALKVAQGFLLSQLKNRRCVYLVDDLPAELDAPHREALCRLFEGMECQVFISCVESEDLENCWKDKEQLKKFHVEHGCIATTH